MTPSWKPAASDRSRSPATKRPLRPLRKFSLRKPPYLPISVFSADQRMAASHLFPSPKPLPSLPHFLVSSLPSPFSLRPPILHTFLVSPWTHPHYFNCPIFPHLLISSFVAVYSLLCILIKKKKKCLMLLQYI